MLQWMLYLTAVGSVMGVAGLLSERGFRHFGRPVRWSWVWCMAATIGLPVVLGLMNGAGGAGPSRHAPLLAAALDSPTMDILLLAAWITLSLVLLGNVRLSAWTLRRNQRSWRRGSMGSEPVLVSKGFGPGVMGASRPRIVLPEWVLGSAPSFQRLILAHETEHVRTRDTRLLLGGVILVTLVPWCIPLWWQLHRLRRAIETDCDARVLAATADPGGYAHALVTVASRPTWSLLPVATLAPGQRELERRIQLITAGGRERSKPSGVGFLVAAAVLVFGLSGVPVPDPPSPNLAFSVEAAGWSAAEPPRGATVILSVAGED